MKNISIVLVVSMSMLAPPSGADARGAVTEHTSPTGKFVVTFKEIAHRTFSKEEQLRQLDNMNHIEYEIAFLRRGEPSAEAGVTYADVYGFNQPPVPTPVDRINKWFDWSPEEDFVLVPSEDWASAPGTSERKVLAMNDRLGWSESWIILQNMVWADPLVAVGDRHNDCDYSVDIFDGKTGEQRPVLESVSPIGHRIASVDGRTVVIRRVLDNCAGPERRAAFEARCWSLHLDTMKLDETACP